MVKFKLIGDLADLFHDLYAVSRDFGDLWTSIREFGQSAIALAAEASAEKLREAFDKARAVYDAFTASFCGKREQIEKVIEDLKKVIEDLK